ncbi:vesicle-associated membrane protein 7-like isoform X1 [Strongylocentrotus purpuratus]|uniref:Vesicle-associated membrane protein 7 n=2 Tax=Strongylocentrotus purpuratus TaxID=7668 RepID=A0A7M7HMN1_STRPU|nr:vesicle-associated membrane protein 7 isoform X1 [Strongylocentrotus purpuratus]XP_030836319.1 vesicle-associated membrane protein 7-like isoform X1 [Strongylocentrotus purpuratus]|eukprot:XP_011681933.1 PREDICTED: vesicle-associated membrane protein 7 isoform X1 [Strongylocentrotus purpuratus]
MAPAPTQKRSYLSYLSESPVDGLSQIYRRPFDGDEMPILYAVIARGTTVLANYAACQGNFTEVTEQVLMKIPPQNAKLTYSHGAYLFHYVSDERIIYMCITDDDFERSRAFAFLQEIKKKFTATYGSRVHTALPFAMNSEFSRVLAAQIRYFAQPLSDHTRMSEVQQDLEELNQIMVRNIESVSNRGERLELLIDKTEDLETTSLTFKKSSKSLARSMFMKNLKLIIILSIVVILVIYFIVSAACGGLDWNRCVK